MKNFKAIVAMILGGIFAFGGMALLTRNVWGDEQNKTNAPQIEESTNDGAIDDGATDSGNSDEGSSDSGTPRDDRTTLIASDITYYAIEVGDNLSGSSFRFHQSTYEEYNGTFKITFEPVSIYGNTYDIYYSGHGGTMYLLDCDGSEAYIALTESYVFPNVINNGVENKFPEFDLIVKSIEYPEDLTTCPFYVDNYTR